MDFNFIFFEDLTQTRAFIYFPSGGVYTLGYCLACWLFWEEFHCVKSFPCLKQQNVGKGGGWGGAHSCLSWFLSKFAAVNVVRGRVWPVFSPAELYRTVLSIFSHLNFICLGVDWKWMIFAGMNCNPSKVFSHHRAAVYIRIPQGLRSFKKKFSVK